MNRRAVWAILTGMFVPYVGTLAWTGTIHGEELHYEQQKELSGKRRILLDRGGKAYYMDLEEYLPGVIARQMPVEYEPEALKAQAIIARTYICRQMEAAGNKDEIAESSLDMDFAETDQLRALWGSSLFPEYYTRLEEAAAATRGITMTFEGHYIDAMFCRATAGSTRAGDIAHAYLQSKPCPLDVEAEGFVSVTIFSKNDMAAALSSAQSALSDQETGGSDLRRVRPEALPDTVQIGSRDEVGYVTQLQIDGIAYTGEQVQFALGLPSACFTLEGYEDNVRITTKGIGHGFGLSQHTANELAKEGWKAQDILGYFYKNIAFISE